MKLQSYIIYLEKNLSRADNVRQLLKFPNARIFPAVDGRLINFQKIQPVPEEKEVDDPEHKISHFIQFGSHLFPHKSELRNKIKKTQLRLGYNEAGCLLSHVYLWCHLANNLKGNEVALIMEDDAVCDDQEGFLKLINDLPDLATWDMCQLFTTSEISKSESVSSGFFESSSAFNRASSYLLTSRGCKTIIEHTKTLDFPADDYLCLLSLLKLLKVIYPEKSLWSIMERNHGWGSSLWETRDAHLNVQWDRTPKHSWIGMSLGYHTGIANQMFQWAAAKIQSMRLGAHLIAEAGPHCVLQLFPYIRDWQQWFGNAPSQAKKSFRSDHLLSPEQWGLANKWSEKNLDYDPTIESLTSDSNWRLEGYLQNLKYFGDYLPLLRMVFAFDEKIKQSCRDFLDQIDEKSGPRIAVHLRLPNLSDEPFENSCYACPTNEFVYASMDKMVSMFPNTRFILCSNDPNRCRSIYNFTKWAVVWAELGLMEDMAVMSMCDHFILSASTYGWWAAMLSENTEKKVIMSKPFFSEKYGKLNEHHNLILPNWIVYDMKKNCFE